MPLPLNSAFPSKERSFEPVPGKETTLIIVKGNNTDGNGVGV